MHLYFHLSSASDIAQSETLLRALINDGHRVTLTAPKWPVNGSSRRLELLASRRNTLRLKLSPQDTDPDRHTERLILTKCRYGPLRDTLLASLSPESTLLSELRQSDADCLIITPTPNWPMGIPRKIMAAEELAIGCVLMVGQGASSGPSTVHSSSLYPGAIAGLPEADQQPETPPTLPGLRLEILPAGRSEMAKAFLNLAGRSPVRRRQRTLRPIISGIAPFVGQFAESKGTRSKTRKPDRGPQTTLAYGPPSHKEDRFIEAADAKAMLERLAQSDLPILVGPWTAEVGFEVLYWIPFLRYALSHYSISPDRIVVASRGGCESWYRDLYGTYVDLFDLMTPEEYREVTQQRNQASGGQKPLSLHALDYRIRDAACEKLGVGEVDWLHPSFMFRLFRKYWHGKESRRLFDSHTEFSLLEKPTLAALDERLQEPYIAVRFYSSTSFPNTRQNQKMAADLIQRLSLSGPVAVIETGLKLDDHSEVPIEGDNVIRIGNAVSPRQNLDLQTRVIANADAFIGTYGGLSYVGGQFGVPSIGIWGDSQGWRSIHLETADRAFKRMGVSFSALSSDAARVFFQLN